MNYWQFSVHAPFNAKEQLIKKYRKKIDPESTQKSATYAAMVHSLDDAVGTLLDAVDEKDIADNTVIVFISDNGGNEYNSIDADGGVAPTDNTPLRGGKASIYEGGIRVPCIVVWPGITKPGSRSNEIIQTSDFYTTLLKGLGIELPKGHTVDGIDIREALAGGKIDREAIFTYFPYDPPVPEWLPPSIAVHSGDWKLIRVFYGGENGGHDYKLYNLANDIGEKNNLASKMPEKVKALDKLIEEHIKDTKAVVPIPNPKFDSKQYHPEKIGVSTFRKNKRKKKK
jgi:arylsulfatase A-like enzyme